jgi:hypothetical protein
LLGRRRRERANNSPYQWQNTTVKDAADDNDLARSALLDGVAIASDEVDIADRTYL